MPLLNFLPTALTGGLPPQIDGGAVGGSSTEYAKMLAKMLAKQGSDYGSIQSHWQGAARLANGAMAGMMVGQDRANNKAMADALKTFVTGGGGSSTDTPSAKPASFTPSGSPFGKSDDPERIGAIGGGSPGGTPPASDPSPRGPSASPKLGADMLSPNTALPMDGPPDAGLDAAKDVPLRKSEFSPQQLAGALGGSRAPNGPVPEMIRTAAMGYNLDPETMTRIAQVESRMNPNAANPNSSARGIYQFMTRPGGSWDEYGKGANPLDPLANIDAGMRYTQDNLAHFKKAMGREPTPGETYLMHQQGRGGATALLRSPDMPAVDALATAYGGDRNKAMQAIVQNGGNPNMTAGQFAQRWTSKFSDLPGRGPSGPSAPGMLNPNPMDAGSFGPAVSPPSGPLPDVQNAAVRPNMPAPNPQAVAPSPMGAPPAQMAQAQPQAARPAQPQPPMPTSVPGQTMPPNVKAYIDQLVKINTVQSLTEAAKWKMQYEGKPQTTDEVKEYQLYVTQEQAAGRPPKTFFDYKTDLKKAGAAQNTVSIDQRGETEFAKAVGKHQAERFDKIVQGANDAQGMIANVQTLRDIGSRITTGKNAQITAALGPYAEMVGIKIDGLDDIQAYEAIISKMAPTMRVPGSGATSDFEMRTFLKALPQLGNTPAGNELISKTLDAMAQHKIVAGDIASRAMSGELTAREAEKQLRELPDPLTLWKKNRDQFGPIGNAPPAPAPARPSAPQPGTVDGGYRFNGGDPSKPENWIKVQ